MAEVQPTRTSEAAEGGGSPRLAERLAGSHVGLRRDLTVTRHLFRGEPVYVVRDPMTLQSHSFGVADYQILVRLDPERSLGEVFRELVDEGHLEEEQEEAFYRFVAELHQMAFLHLPVSNAGALYRRYEARRRARRLARLQGIFFVQIPLLDPDGFLDRTARFARPLFSRAAFGLYLGLLGLAGLLLARNFDDFLHPGHRILDARNLPAVWLTLVLLKVVHEFGHAYACKLRGGRVPEMGVFLILGTPFAYVDASAAWGFVRPLDRIVVSLAGVYVETLIAALAVLVWATTASAQVAALAHNVVLLGGLVTVVLNINPLMRFDGYYLLSDLVQIPNLRARASEELRQTAKQWLLGIEPAAEFASRRTRFILRVYGLCAGLYRVGILLTISILVATKAFLLGVLLAGAFLASQVYGLLRGLVRYLWRHEETAAVRVRAVALSFVLLIALPALSLSVPLPGRIILEAELGRAGERVVRAEQSGFVERLVAGPGSQVEAGDLLVETRNPRIEERVLEAEARYRAAELRARAELPERVGRALGRERLAEVEARELARRREEAAALAVKAPVSGVVVAGLTERDAGRFVERGEPLATLAGGPWRLRALLSEQDLAVAGPIVGETVEARLAGAPGVPLRARIVRVSPRGSRTIRLENLTQLAGGGIPVDPQARTADRPYFELEAELEDPPPGPAVVGRTARLRLRGEGEPPALWIYRRFLRVMARIAQG